MSAPLGSESAETAWVHLSFDQCYQILIAARHSGHELCGPLPILNPEFARLLFLYLGVIALHQAIESPRIAARACALLSVVGVINIPIIHYSVVWWNTLHQGSTIRPLGGSTMETDMIIPLLIGALGFTLIFGWLTLWRMRAQLIWRERRSRWVTRMIHHER